MSGWLFLGIMSAVCVADVLIALRFLRMADRPDREVGAPAKPSAVDPVKARQMSRAMLIITPIMWLVFAALAFGLFGPVKNIQTIKF